MIKRYSYLTSFFADLDETDVQSNESLQKFFGALPLIGAMLAAIGYQFGLSPIAWSYSGKFHKRYHWDIKSKCIYIHYLILKPPKVMESRPYVNKANLDHY